MKKKVIIIIAAVIAAIMIFAVVYALVSDPEGVKESLTETTSSAQVSEATSGTTENTTTNNMPIVAGSNAYDFTVSLKQNGMPEAERSATSDGYSFTAADSNYSYSIETDSEYRISYGRFMVLSEDNGFLGFCASFPCDANSGTEAQSWVNDHVGEETSTIIGSAEFILSNGNQGPILEIKAIGRDEYVENKLISE